MKRSAFTALVERINRMIHLANNAKTRSEQSTIGDWLDSQDVCLILNISKRTLQYYRNKRILPYSKIENKVYYRPEDVEKLIRSGFHPAKKK